jgi:hypothetical protein
VIEKGFGPAAARVTLKRPRHAVIMTLKSGITAIWVGTALLLGGCYSPKKPPRPARPPPVHLTGSVHGSIYSSAEGGFSVPFPVSADLNGRVMNDGPQNVTFTDNWGSHITFYGQAILEQSAMIPMLEKEGREKALGDFARHIYGDIITVHYHPEAREGTISFIYLRPATRKTAVAVFIRGHRLYLVETDTLPGEALLAQSDEKSQLERESKLEDRAVALARTMDVK